MNKTIIFAMLILLIGFISPAGAWGVTYDSLNYEMVRGETRDIEFSIQNYAGNDSLKFKILLSGDTEIITQLNEKETHLLPPKTKKYLIPFRISIPEDAKDYYSFDVIFSADSIEDSMIKISSERAISVKINVTNGFNKNVLKKYTEEDFEPVSDYTGEIKDTITGNLITGGENTIFYIIAIALIVAVAAFTFYKKPKNSWD